MTPLILDMVHHNPGEPKTVSDFTDPAFLKRWGYTGQVWADYAQAAVLPEEIDPKAAPADSETIAWIAERARFVAASAARTKAAGLLCFFHTDFFIFPRCLAAADPTILDSSGRISLDSEQTRHWLRGQLAAIFRKFPDIDGLVVRHGETYLNGLPHHVGNGPIARGLESHRLFLALLFEEICVKAGKYLIYRTWDFNGLHTNPDRYAALADSFAPHPLLYFSLKHVQGDFWRGFPFNPALGVGRHRQIVEIQCQREYEGKGAHPNYVAAGVWTGFAEQAAFPDISRYGCLRDFAADERYGGICTWSRGGGWDGPRIACEFWTAMNACVLALLASGRAADEAAAFDAYLESECIPEPDRPALREIALLSAEAVLRGQASYDAAPRLYYDQLRASRSDAAYSIEGGYEILWTRDQYIGGAGQTTRTIASLLAGGLAEAFLAEKRRAAELWFIMEALATSLTDAGPTNRFIKISCSYGRIKYASFLRLWTALLADAELNRTEDPAKKLAAAEAAATAIAEWNTPWPYCTATAPATPTGPPACCVSFWTCSSGIRLRTATAFGLISWRNRSTLCPPRIGIGPISKPASC